MRYYYFTYLFYDGEKKDEAEKSPWILAASAPLFSYGRGSGFGSASVAVEGEFFIDYWRKHIDEENKTKCIITWFTEISKAQYEEQSAKC